MTYATALALATFVASTVNGALGYGFSSLVVPVALFFLTNRVLNPAIVLVQVPVNAYVLWVNRASVPQVARRVMPIAIGLVPGIAAGTLVVSRVNPSCVKLATLVALLPLILAQAGGYRRPFTAERAAGGVFGLGVGVLYAVTTISGPPLAVLLNNQGFARRDFRAALGIVRLTESVLTALAYWSAGLYSSESVRLVPVIAPSVIVGIPLGMILIRGIAPETFRRACMSFDAWIVGYGLSVLLRDLRLAPPAYAWTVFWAVVAIDTWLLYRFFVVQRRGVSAGQVDRRTGGQADLKVRTTGDRATGVADP